MVLALKPFGCMPSSQSDGVQSTVISRFPEVIFLPIETAGEGEINAHSRVQMALGEAKAKAKAEFDRCLAHTRQRLEDVRDYVAQHAELRSPLYRVPRSPDVAGVAANFVLHVSDLMNGKGHRGARERQPASASTARHAVRIWVALEISSFKCGHDAPVYTVVERIVEQSDTPYFCFKDLDENKPAASIKIRVETIDCFLKRYRDDLVRRKRIELEIETRLGQYERWLRETHGLLDASYPGCVRKATPASA
jgi:hypothetical protein